MSTREKLLDVWLNNPPKFAKKHEVEAVLNWFFPGEYTNDGGSHIVVTSERVKGVPGTDALGKITIPVYGGQQVKGRYVNNLAKAIDFLRTTEKDG